VIPPIKAPRFTPPLPKSGGSIYVNFFARPREKVDKAKKTKQSKKQNKAKNKTKQQKTKQSKKNINTKLTKTKPRPGGRGIGLARLKTFIVLLTYGSFCRYDQNVKVYYLDKD